MTGNDSLCSLPLIPTADPVNLCCRTRPNTPHGVVAGLAEELGHAGLFQNELVAINWKLTPCFALPILEGLHPIIKTGDRHSAVAVVKRGKQLCERGYWIRHCASKNTGMQIHFRSGYFDLHCGHPPQPIT